MYYISEKSEGIPESIPTEDREECAGVSPGPVDCLAACSFMAKLSESTKAKPACRHLDQFVISNLIILGSAYGD